MCKVSTRCRRLFRRQGSADDSQNVLECRSTPAAIIIDEVPPQESSDCSDECFGDMQAGRADGTFDGALQPEASRWLEDEGVL